MSSKPLVIYHGNCADGFAAAWCFKTRWPEECDFHAGVYQEDPPIHERGRTIYLVDFSYKREVVESLLRLNSRIILIDHHKTALEDLKLLMDAGAIEHYCDLKRSGAMLAWDYINIAKNEAQRPPKLLEYIQHRDLWRHKKEPEHELSYATEFVQNTVFSFPYDFDVWSNLMKVDTDGMRIQGEAITRKHFKDIIELLAVGQREIIILGHTIPVCNLPYTMSSDAGHIMAKGKKFAACYMDTPKGRVFSLRSKFGEAGQEQALDVSEIAKQFGGGGHSQAAGFTIGINIAHCDFELC